jgi:hypothetical protein
MLDSQACVQIAISVCINVGSDCSDLRCRAVQDAMFALIEFRKYQGWQCAAEYGEDYSIASFYLLHFFRLSSTYSIFHFPIVAGYQGK